jgi:predicted ATPase
VLAALAQQHPLVLLLEDLHWADGASLDLVRYLSRQAAALPLLLLVTYRGDELTRRHPLYALLPLLVRDEAVRSLLDERYGLPPSNCERLVTYLARRAEGNPFFIGELL